MEKSSKIYVAGHNGLVGSAILRLLKSRGFKNIVVRTKEELDLTRQSDVENFFSEAKPEYVFLAAAKVGGIMANKVSKADFIYENLQIQNNIIFSSWKNTVKKLLFLGSSCIYPKFAEQPIKEESLLTGALEESNDAYAVAKIAGIKMCQSFNEQYGTNYISAMPTNLYGINDNFDLNSSHVIPALIRKFLDAKAANLPEITLWGSGKPLREFLYVDDLADALLFLMDSYNDSSIINIGTGSDMTIAELATTISRIVGFNGEIKWDLTKPDGTPKKQLDVSKINKLGWKSTTSLEEGIKKTIEWYSQK